MKVVFVGSNQNIRQLTDICHARGYEVVGILDQDYWTNVSQLDTIPIIGSEIDWTWSTEYSYFIATNWVPGSEPVNQRNQQKRQSLIQLLKQHRVSCINLIHPAAVVPATCKLGHGIFIGANAVLANHCEIGDYCQIREQSYLAHAVTLGQNVVLQVQTYIGSGVVVEDNSYIGIKSSVIPPSVWPADLTVPENTFVKAHSLVTKNTRLT